MKIYNPATEELDDTNDPNFGKEKIAQINKDAQEHYAKDDRGNSKGAVKKLVKEYNKGPRQEDMLERINRINYETGITKKKPPHIDNKNIVSYETANEKSEGPFEKIVSNLHKKNGPIAPEQLSDSEIVFASMKPDEAMEFTGGHDKEKINYLKKVKAKQRVIEAHYKFLTDEQKKDKKILPFEYKKSFPEELDSLQEEQKKLREELKDETYEFKLPRNKLDDLILSSAIEKIDDAMSGIGSIRTNLSGGGQSNKPKDPVIRKINLADYFKVGMKVADLTPTEREQVNALLQKMLSRNKDN